jgi:hypothetical protein
MSTINDATSVATAPNIIPHEPTPPQRTKCKFSAEQIETDCVGMVKSMPIIARPDRGPGSAEQSAVVGEQAALRNKRPHGGVT